MKWMVGVVAGAEEATSLAEGFRCRFAVEVSSSKASMSSSRASFNRLSDGLDPFVIFVGAGMD